MHSVWCEPRVTFIHEMPLKEIAIHHMLHATLQQASCVISYVLKRAAKNHGSLKISHISAKPLTTIALSAEQCKMVIQLLLLLLAVFIHVMYGCRSPFPP